jgi:ribosome biogenesis GTPase
LKIDRLNIYSFSTVSRRQILRNKNYLLFFAEHFSAPEYELNFKNFGFDTFWEAQLELARSGHEHRQLVAGRVSADFGGHFVVQTNDGPINTLHGAERMNESNKRRKRPRPTVGDWVWLEIIPNDIPVARIVAVAERKTLFTRPDPSSDFGVQTIAANMDYVLLLTAANDEFNLARIGRYLTQIARSGAEPVLVLTKCDLSESLAAFIEGLREANPHCRIFNTSCQSGLGLEDVSSFLHCEKTFLLLGSSGVGKSTLLNRLSGKDLMRTATISGLKDQGRHTTTHRELVVLPQGALLIDGPGLRSLGVESSDSVAETFSDVVALTRECRFSNCRHGTEPECAIQEAVRTGVISDQRLRQFKKLHSEAVKRQRLWGQKARIR